MSNIRTWYLKLRLRMSPQQNLFFGFAAYTIIGWLLLCLPFVRNTEVGFLDNLFMATSAISTTGLATVSTFDSYNMFGQAIILLLIQIGGIGYMTFTSFILLSSNNNIKHWQQRILNAEFSMPEGFDLRDFVRSVIVFTVVIEILGAIAFFIAFKMAGVETGFAVWSSIFHSISSFCTAGFGLYNNSFESFADNTFINVIISVLSIAGALGFIVVLDVWQRFRGLRDKLTYTTKVICGVFLVIVLFGTLIIFFFEPSVAGMGLYDRAWVSFFQSMSAITTVGFNNIPMGVLSVPTLLALCFVMYIGSSPSGTGGGLKSTTFAAITGVVWSKIRGHHKVQFFGSRIPEARTSVAVSSFIFYTGFIFLAIFLLSFSEQTPLQNIMFEVISAISTVGLSVGITGGLTAFGKIVIISIMFIGRLGVLTFGLALLARSSTQTPPLKDETDLAV